MATLRNKVIRLAHENPELRKHLIPILKQSRNPTPPNIDDVTNALEKMKTTIGGRMIKVEYYNQYKSWRADPANRQRLDHYGNDGEGWDDEAWSDEYADPLGEEVSQLLEKRFGPGIFEVDIGEKGHVHISLTKKVKSLL